MSPAGAMVTAISFARLPRSDRFAGISTSAELVAGLSWAMIRTRGQGGQGARFRESCR